MRGPFRRVKRRLFWRVYLYGIALLLAVVLAVGLLMSGRSAKSWHKRPNLVHDFAATELQRQPDLATEYAQLPERLTRLADVARADLWLVDEHGQVAAHAAHAGNAPAAGPELSVGEPRSERFGLSWVMVLPIEVHGRPHALLVRPRALAHPGGILAILFAVFGTVALVLWPLARNLARPLERIAAAAEDLGRGRLQARARVVRNDEIGALARSFDEMADRIERLVTAEREMLANVSHEFRTPMSRIRVALELCEESDTVADVHEQLGGIAGDIRELEQLVEDVLVTARLDLSENDGESAPFLVRREPVELVTIIERATARFSRKYPEISVDADVENILLDVDRALVRRLVENLLGNAATYGSSGGGLAQIQLATRVDANTVEIVIRDHGPGVPEVDLERLFEPFFRVDRSRGERAGIGMGLTLCRRIAEAHGGTLVAANADPGLRLVVTLPVADGSELQV